MVGSRTASDSCPTRLMKCERSTMTNHFFCRTLILALVMGVSSVALSQQWTDGIFPKTGALSNPSLLAKAAGIGTPANFYFPGYAESLMPTRAGQQQGPDESGLIIENDSQLRIRIRTLITSCAFVPEEECLHCTGGLRKAD